MALPARRIEDPDVLFLAPLISPVIMTGNQAYARGLYEAGVQFFATYPGTPASEIGDAWQCYSKNNPNVIYDLSLNETVAFEAAVGAAWSGIRSAVAFKHLGMNLIADPLHTVMYSGINGDRRAGLVIICGGDPELSSSTNAQDIRLFAWHSKIPILEPSNIQECKDFVSLAFDLSELWNIPILIYSPTRLHHASGPVHVNTAPPFIKNREGLKFEKNFSKYVNAIFWARENQAKLDGIIHQIENSNDPKPKISSKKGKNSQQENYPLFHIDGNPADTLNKLVLCVGDNGSSAKLEPVKVGFIASGIAWTYLSELCLRIQKDLPRLRLHLTYPVEIQAIYDFVSQVQSEILIIIEEQEPFIETQIKNILYDHQSEWKSLPIILGKNIFPRVGALSPDGLLRILGNPMVIGDETFWFEECHARLPHLPEIIDQIQHDLPVREPTFCPGCSHRNVFYTLQKAATSYQQATGIEPVYGGDIGCYAMSMSAPYHTLDWMTSMGAGTGIANGVARMVDPRKQHVVAMVGDSTFFHTGIQPVINLAKNNVPVTILILDNYFCAMTGQQLSPSTPSGLAGKSASDEARQSRSFSIKALLSSLGDFPIFELDGYSIKKMIAQFEKAFALPGLKFVLVTAECALNKFRRLKVKLAPESPQTTLQITDSCVQCDECFETLGCTAIQDVEGQYTIDQSRCMGEYCMSCREVCPNHAILKTEINPHKNKNQDINQDSDGDGAG